MKTDLKYFNEDDKCYGVTGMAIGIMVFDGEKMLASVSLDADPESVIEFSEPFYFCGNPGLSAKDAWNSILRNFNLSMGMSIANVMCRSLVLNQKPVSDDQKKMLCDCVLEEGRDTCSLEDDETMRLFNKNYTYLTRVFTHRGVQGVAHDFAGTLKRRRTMSGSEVFEALSALLNM